MKDTISKEEQKYVLKRLLEFAKPYRRPFFLAFLLLLAATVADLLGPILIKVFIDDYLTPKKLDAPPLILLGAAYLGLHILKVVVQYFQHVKFNEIALHIIQDIRVDIFSKVQRMPMKYFDETPVGSIVSRVTNDTETIKEMFVDVAASFVQNSFFLVGIFIAMFYLNVKLAMFCLLLLPILYGLMKMYRHFSAIFYYRMREKLSQLNTKLNESLQGMNMIQVFRQEKRLIREFAAINEEHYMAGLKNIKLDGLLLRPAVDLIYIFALMLVLGFFGFSSQTSPIEIGVLYAFVNYLERFFEPVNQMMMRLSIYQQAIVSASRVFDLLDEVETGFVGGKNAPDCIHRGTIAFKNVTFSYDGQRDILKNISFEVKEGETLALVGHTGSGKSSIINLLLRFYPIKAGDILIDGHSISRITNEEIRRKIGLVLQDPFLFARTLKENIIMHDQTIRQDEVEKSAQLVQAHSFIESLPNKYEEYAAERGANFSSGQRQLIAFSRTIVRSPKILVLDEATAHIDTETEEAIQTAMERMREGRTTIIIAHRLSTIQNAHQIIVLHKGEVAERGTHQELLEKQGLYYKMYLLQNGTART
ncbi:ABC transporter ATP-binding protein [Priestia abyssalis]|uniref:ABC transporter ATP-binding protein n=1 Tax=Priestia abyssalis TaxID=1221450 RepID=UPI0019584D20|nr:ABC transporter transmembrane domain-containing protein [Priestia abyssalis]